MLFDVASLEIRTRARMTFPIANFFSNIGWYCKYVFGGGYMLNLASMICMYLALSRIFLHHVEKIMFWTFFIQFSSEVGNLIAF